MKGFPVEFGIGVRGSKCLNDGPTRLSKKFSDRLSRFHTIPAVTDTHPSSQPPSHVAVAITLNAKASSLKTAPSTPLSINGAPLPYVSSCRDLGIIATSDLTPTVHVNYIVFKAHQRANAIHRCFTSRNTDLLVRA